MRPSPPASTRQAARVTSSHTNASGAASRVDWGVTAIVAGACVLLGLFFVLDWGRGPARALLLVLLAALAWRAACREPRPLPTGRTSLRQVLLFVVALGGIAFHLDTGVRSIHRATSTRSIELDQGQISYRASRYLIERGVNPYGREIPLDTTELRIGLDELIEPEDANLAVGEIDAALESGTDPSAVWELVPRPGDDPGKQEAWQGLSSRLGYKYGPLQLALYTPAVALCGHAGIYVVHQLLYLGIVAAVIAILRRWWPDPGVPWAVALIIIHIPPHIAHNTLDLSATDLLPLLCGLLAVLCFLGGRGRLTALFVGASIASKLFPGALYVPLLLAVRPRDWWPLPVVLAASYGPFLAWDAPGLVANLVSFNFVRSTDSTALVHFLRPGTAWLVKGLGIALIGYGLWRAMRAGWTPRATLAYLLVAHGAAFLAAGTFHNNYLIWVTPLLGLFLAVALFQPVTSGRTAGCSTRGRASVCFPP